MIIVDGNILLVYSPMNFRGRECDSISPFFVVIDMFSKVKSNLSWFKALQVGKKKKSKINEIKGNP